MTTNNKQLWLQGYVDEVQKEIERLGSDNEDEDPEAVERFEVAILSLRWSLGVLRRHALVAAASGAFDQSTSPIQ